jgi:glycosyltransferase involved in cell wall biosynthesis
LIIVCVRTRDEERRIGQFCESYVDADKILVADGGSEDNTIKVAEKFPNVEIRHFTERVQLENGYWRNNDSDHANFLFEWAEEYNPDWIIYDDCDCRPNYLLRKDYRGIFERTKCDVVMAVRVYLWGEDKYLEKLSSPFGELSGQASLYAWRGSLGMRTVDVPPAYTFRAGDRHISDFRIDMKTAQLFYPHCILHYSWDDRQRVDEKLKTYRESGFIPGQLHPLEFGGNLKDLEWFMHE